MKILIDLTALADNFSGIERFALSITKELIKNSANQWVLLFKNSIHKDFCEEQENVEKIVIKGGNKLVFNQVVLPAKLSAIRADKYFFPAFSAPFFFFNKNTYNTIHDLGCWDCPGTNKKHMIWYFKLMYWKAALNNKKIITVSEFSKERICTILHAKPENVSVVYNGISGAFNAEKSSADEFKKAQEKYSLPEKYILCLSTMEPRKNLRLMLDVFASLYSDGVVEEVVLAGRKGWKMDDFLKGYNAKFLQHIHFTGFVDDEDLPTIYSGASWFVFPTKYEGFGIPPLESMACGTPVISSDAASMPEVLGNSAIYFENNSFDSLNQKVKIALSMSEIEKQKLIKRGLQQIKRFSWQNEAAKLNEIFKGHDK